MQNIGTNKMRCSWGALFLGAAVRITARRATSATGAYQYARLELELELEEHYQYQYDSCGTHDYQSTSLPLQKGPHNRMLFHHMTVVHLAHFRSCRLPLSVV
jgi:hypothetical protein